MPLSVQDFSAKIKAKYPQYATMDDATLAQKIVDKHPEYKTQVDFGGSSAPNPTMSSPTQKIDYGKLSDDELNAALDQENKTKGFWDARPALAASEDRHAKNFFGGIANFVTDSTIKPIAKAAVALPTTAYKSLEGFGKAVADLPAAIQQSGGDWNKKVNVPYGIDEINKSAAAPVNVPWLGNINNLRNDKSGNYDFMKSNINNAATGVDALSGIANLAIPESAAGIKGLKGLALAAARGAAQSGAKAAQEDDATVLNTTLQALLGGSLSGLFSKPSTQYLGEKSKKLAENIYSKIVKTPLKAAINGTDIGKGLLERGIKGSDNKMLEQVSGLRSKALTQRSGLLNNSNKKIDTGSLIDKFLDKTSSVSAPLGKEKEYEDALLKMASSLEKKGPSISASTASSLKTALYKDAKNAFGTDSAPVKEAQKTLARLLKEAVEKNVDGVGNVNADLGFLKQAQKILQKNVIQGDQKKLIGLGDTAAGALASLLGGPLAAPAAIGAKKVLGSSSVQSGSAQALKNLSQSLLKSKGDRAGILTQGILKALLGRK